jgi:hypothetical protein
MISGLEQVGSGSGLIVKVKTIKERSRISLILIIDIDKIIIYHDNQQNI